ncbi:MAG: CerR family C-terminal domain-containing protein [Phycisphaerae bacterium]|nr:CerR family C-terminal domain-containing protein [Phycisphaerae bacterium]
MAGKTTFPQPGPRATKRRDAIETQSRLLDAAGRLFAANGYDETGVREICRTARVNLAAVRHHFGGKEGLYRAVILRSHQGFLQQDPMPRFRQSDDPAEALGRAVEHMLRIVLVRRAGHPYAGQLIARELRAPTPALDELLKTVMKPVRKELTRIVGALLGTANTRQLRGQCTNFVIGLCVFHELGKEALARFGFPPPRKESEVPALATRITAFALGGLRQFAGGKRDRRGPRRG